MLRRLLILLAALLGAMAPSPVSSVALAAPSLLPAAPGSGLGPTLPDRMPQARTSYRTLAGYDAAIGRLVTEHPAIARRIVLARRSVRGREIAGVEIAADPGRPDDGRPALVVLGTVHAREWASGEVAMAFLEDLAAAYGRDARVSALVDALRVVVVPVVNPDGFVLSRGGRRRLQRTNAGGVDLNRNAAAWWGGRGASPLRGAADYRGAAPWSAPEAEAVHQLLQTLPVTALVSLHSVAGVVVYPPGPRAVPHTPDEQLAAAMARRMGDAAGYRSGDVTRLLYPVSGSLDDWAFAAEGALAATVELGGSGFFGPYEDNVVRPYLGRPARRRGTSVRPQRARRPHGGVREALLRAAETAASRATHGVLEGPAPPGAQLTAVRVFTTTTSPLCPDGLPFGCGTRARPREVPDGASARLTVGPAGSFAWHLGPSTRPLTRLEGRQEAWTITCAIDGAEVARHDVVVERGAAIALAPCAAP